MNECVHRWIIDAPNGPTSVGHCTHCGAVRDFVNTPVEHGKLQHGLRTKYGDLMGRLQIASRLVFDGHSKPSNSGWVR